MKIYKDSGLTEEIPGRIHLGRVRAGTSGSMVVYVHNEEENIAWEKLKFSAEDPTVLIKWGQTVLGPNLSMPVELTWNAPLNLKKALGTFIDIDGDKVYLVPDE